MHLYLKGQAVVKPYKTSIPTLTSRPCFCAINLNNAQKWIQSTLPFSIKCTRWNFEKVCCRNECCIFYQDHFLKNKEQQEMLTSGGSLCCKRVTAAPMQQELHLSTSSSSACFPSIEQFDTIQLIRLIRYCHSLCLYCTVQHWLESCSTWPSC